MPITVLANVYREIGIILNEQKMILFLAQANLH
jgi:hypothetical protein